MAIESCTMETQKNYSLIPRPNVTKIPGELPTSKPDRYVEDLSKLTKVQLLEIKEREEKLLLNKLRLSKLPDKGKRIQDFYEKVLKEIQHRDEVEKAAELFSDLNIASKGQAKLDNMEWNGKYDPNFEEQHLDSDDEDETNPLKIIAGSMSEKKVKILKPEIPLITEEDLKEIESLKTEISPDEHRNIKNDGSNNNPETIVNAEIVEIDVAEKLTAIKPKLKDKLNATSTSSHNSSTSSLNLEPHVLYLFEKGVDGLPQKEKFKPYKTTKSNVHDPEKEKLRKPLGKYWEVTSATPPPIQHSGVQMLPLQDSVEIQAQYLERLKKLQEKQAEERLAARIARKSELGSIIVPDESMLKLNQFFGGYRTTATLNDDDESSDEECEYECRHQDKVTLSDDEVRDDDDERDGGSVVFPVYN